MTKESLIKQLEDTCYGLDPVDPLRLLVDDVIAALAQEQEPVAYYHPHKGFYFAKPTSVSAPTIVDVEPLALYTTPPQRSESSGKPSAWVGLTDDDKKQIKKEANYHWEMTAGEYAELIGQLTEAKLREKNSQHKEKNT